MLLQNNDRLLFTGDSITDAGRARPIGEGTWGLGTGYVSMIDTILNAFYPQMNIHVLNTGVSGNTVRDLKERWQSDVLDLEPDWISICIGVNDVWRQFDCPQLPHKPVQPDEYRDTLNELVASAKANAKKGVLVLSPFFMEPLREDWMRARMDEYNVISCEIAAAHGVEFIDLQVLFDDYLQHRHSSYLSWDRVHPNQPAALLMAQMILQKFGINLAISDQ